MAPSLEASYTLLGASGSMDRWFVVNVNIDTAPDILPMFNVTNCC
jgi:hypothetical protein